MKEWKQAPLGHVLRHRKGGITIDDATTYKLCRVQLHRRGVVLRERLLGAEIRTKNQQLCKTGDFLVAEMDAKVGGYGFVPQELDGAIVSSHYYLFEVDTKKLYPPYLEVVCQAGILQRQIVAKGSTNYSSVRPAQVLDWNIPLPDMEVQKRIARNFRKVREGLSVVAAEISHQQSLLAKLKQAILQEAIQGKLTDDWRIENPDVEPAQQLIHRIRAQKARLIAAKKIRPEKPLQEIKDDEIPFPLPYGWTWCRLGSLYEVVRGSSPRPKGDSRFFSKTRTPYHWIKISDFTPFGVDGALTNTAEFLTAEGTKHSRAVGPSDLIIACSGVGSVGKSLQLAISGYIYDGLLAIRGIKDITIRNFLALYIRFKEITIYSFASGANWLNINTDILSNYVVPFPPLEEQAAIIERVAALMTKCCALEGRIKQSQSQAADLMQAILKEAFSQDVVPQPSIDSTIVAPEATEGEISVEKLKKRKKQVVTAE